MTIFAEVLAALVLSFVLIQGYRALRGTKVVGRDTVTIDLFLGIGAVAVTVLWFRVLSTALVA